MSDSKASPHSCDHCQNVLIDETGLDLRYPFLDVKEISKTCDFFNWALNLPPTSLSSSDELHISVSCETEDLHLLVAGWNDKDGRVISLEDTERDNSKGWLRIFASDGKFLLLNDYW